MTIETPFPSFEELDQNSIVLQVDSFESTEDDQSDSSELDNEDTEQEETDEAAETPVSDPLAQTVYETLLEKGYLEEDPAFDGTFETLDEKIDNLPKKLLANAISELPAHSQVVLKYIGAAGANLNEDELKTYLREYLNEQVVPDVSSLDGARSYVEQHLKSQGLRPSAITAQLDELEDANELITEAEKLLKSKEKGTDRLLQEKEAENQRIQAEQKEFVKSINTTLSDLGWSKPQQEKVLQTIPKTNQVLQNVVKNPKAYIQLMDFLSRFDGKEFNLEHVRRQGESRAASNIKAKLEKSGYSSTTNKTSSSEESPTSDIFKTYKPVV